MIEDCVKLFEFEGNDNLTLTSNALTFCYNVVNNSHTRSELNEISKMIDLQKTNKQTNKKTIK